MDGVADDIDLDDDNDGILDEVECPNTNATFTLTSAGTTGDESGNLILPSGDEAAWNITQTYANGGNFDNVGINPDGDVYFSYSGGSDWDLTANFQVIYNGSSPFNLALVGNQGVNATFGSKFSTYTISWEDGTCLLYTSPSPRDRG